MSDKQILDPVESVFIASSVNRPVDLDACDVSGKVRILRVECTVPKGKTADTFVIGRLPSGHSLFLGHLSLIEVSPVPAEVTFDLGMGTRQEPLGERLAADLTAFVEGKEVKAFQSLLGKLDQAKVRATAQTEVIMTTSEPLPEGTVIRGYLAFSAD